MSYVGLWQCTPDKKQPNLSQSEQKNTALSVNTKSPWLCENLQTRLLLQEFSEAYHSQLISTGEKGEMGCSEKCLAYCCPIILSRQVLRMKFNLSQSSAHNLLKVTLMCSLKCEDPEYRGKAVSCQKAAPRELLKYKGPGSETRDPQGARDMA